jgi:FixJ family two-component response regulator
VGQHRKDAHKCELTSRVERLSSRQREVFDLLLTGARSKQIAKNLGVGEKTVAKHRAAILEKLNVENVVELVRLFVEVNLPHAAPAAAVAS